MFDRLIQFIIERALSLCRRFDYLDAFVTLGESHTFDKRKCKRSPYFRCDLLAIDYSKPTLAIEKYSYQLKKWSRLDKISLGVTSFGAEFNGEKLFIIGGIRSGNLVPQMTSTQVCVSIDIETKIKENLHPMREARWGHSTIIVDDNIYAIGGCNANGILLRTAER